MENRIQPLQNLRLRRRQSSSRMLALSLAMSLVVSLVLHGIMLFAMGRMHFDDKISQLMQPAKKHIAKDEWIIFPWNEDETQQEEEVSGTRLRKGTTIDLNDDQLTVDDVNAVADTDTSIDSLKPLEVPEVKATDLENVAKELKITGVEVSSTPENKLDVVSFTPVPTPEMTPDIQEPKLDAVTSNEAMEAVPVGESMNTLGERLDQHPGVLPDAVVLSEGVVGQWTSTVLASDDAKIGAELERMTGKASLAAAAPVRKGISALTGGGGGGMPGGGVGVGFNAKGSRLKAIGDKDEVSKPGHASIGVKIRIGNGLDMEIPTMEADEETTVSQTPVIQSDAPLVEETRKEEGGERIEASRALEEFVNIRLRLTRDPSGGGYYEVQIVPNEKCDDLHDVAKDVLFIIDHSGSIGGRLHSFKSMTCAMLEYLNPQDRFNVVLFTNNSRSLFTKFVSPTEPNKSYAIKKISSLVCGGTTDVYGGIGPYVKRGNGEALRPLIIFLMSDGQSTVDFHRGDLLVDNTKDNDVLRAIATANPGNVSVYPFSAGHRANRELLDFMALLNSGTPLYVSNDKDFGAPLLSYMRTHTQLLVRDFRYIAEGRVGEEIYPKSLPHLYRREPLSIFGHFEEGDKELVLTLLGYDADGKLRRLVFSKRFADCEEYFTDTVAEGVSLREQWISQKALHLLSEWVLHKGENANSMLQKRRRMELQQLLGSIAAFSKYTDLLKN